ncbi:MAG: hypothetical protein RIT04_322 [Candidatus Parcubacteria bacterium]|jgi:hypothetical protein
MKDIKNTNTYIISALILGGAFIIAAFVGGYTYYSVQSLSNTLSVTGSAKQSVTADSAKWTIGTSQVVTPDRTSSGYETVTDATTRIREYLVKHGIPADQISVSPIFTDEYYGGPNESRKVNVHQNITVTSPDVKKIQSVSQNMKELAVSGVQFSPMSPEYYISNLPELRVSLLGAAVTDARARAASIGKTAGQSIGKLKSASSGVIQVLPKSSTDISDYGQYDTSTIEKDVMVTVRAIFLVK